MSKQRIEMDKDGAPIDQTVLVRDDLWVKDGTGVLGIVRDDYVPFQNVDAFEFLDPLIESKAAIYDAAGI